MKTGTAFALAASQPIAREVRFVLRDATNIVASCRTASLGQASSYGRDGALRRPQRDKAPPLLADAAARRPYHFCRRAVIYFVQKPGKPSIQSLLLEEIAAHLATQRARPSRAHQTADRSYE